MGNKINSNNSWLIVTFLSFSVFFCYICLNLYIILFIFIIFLSYTVDYNNHNFPSLWRQTFLKTSFFMLATCCCWWSSRVFIQFLFFEKLRFVRKILGEPIMLIRSTSLCFLLLIFWISFFSLTSFITLFCLLPFYLSFFTKA